MVSPISAGGGYAHGHRDDRRHGVARDRGRCATNPSSNRVKEGQKTEALLDAYPDWTIPSHVINIVPTADRQKATVRVRIAFDVLEPRILPDMGGR